MVLRLDKFELTLINFCLNSDAPPAYTSVASSSQQPPQYYAPPPCPPQQQQRAPSPNYMTYQQQQQQQPQTMASPSSFQYDSRRGLLGNLVDFAGSSIVNATAANNNNHHNNNNSTVSTMSRNASSYLNEFAVDFMTRKDKKNLKKVLKHERRECKREAKRERRAMKHGAIVIVQQEHSFGVPQVRLCNNGSPQPQVYCTRR